ncbi:MAG TPA: T9SS type A sorting domain-containing protein, partial [Bacteroidia bacterium]
VECLLLNEATTMTISDILGNTIYHSTFTTQHNTIDVSNLAEGVYQLIIHNSSFIITKKIVVQH